MSINTILGEREEEMTPEEEEQRDRALGAHLPTVIHAVGKYITRRGQTAVVTAIRTKTAEQPYSCVGYITVLSGSKESRRVASEWMPNGRWRAMGEHQNDIVGSQ